MYHTLTACCVLPLHKVWSKAGPVKNSQVTKPCSQTVMRLQKSIAYSRVPYEPSMECPLCLEGYKTPRMLPCQHCFCEHCLKQHISINSKPGGTFQCPNCRQEVGIPKEGTAGFPISFTLNKLQDALANLDKLKCSNCWKSGTTKMCLLCLQCFPSHHHSTSETSTDDPTAELGGAFGGFDRIIPESIFCKKHSNKQINLYCVDCKEAICTTCTNDHKRHAIIGQEKPVLIHQLPRGEYESIRDIALCEDGEVYITTNRGVKVYSTAGVYKHTLAHNADADAISFESDRTVKVFSKDGSYIHTVAAGHGGPGRMALLHNGALAVCYPGEKCVRVFKDCGEHAEFVSVIRSLHLRGASNSLQLVLQRCLSSGGLH